MADTYKLGCITLERISDLENGSREIFIANMGRKQALVKWDPWIGAFKSEPGHLYAEGWMESSVLRVVKWEFKHSINKRIDDMREKAR